VASDLRGHHVVSAAVRGKVARKRITKKGCLTQSESRRAVVWVSAGNDMSAVVDDVGHVMPLSRSMPDAIGERAASSMRTRGLSIASADAQLSRGYERGNTARCHVRS
jgi:hypothetical protein